MFVRMGDAPAQGLEHIKDGVNKVVYTVSEWEMRPLRDWNCRIHLSLPPRPMFVRMGDAPAQGLEPDHLCTWIRSGGTSEWEMRPLRDWNCIVFCKDYGCA